jgi:dTDP-glucose 4,6-dehydratase
LGKQVCDWIHVDHAARGLIKVFESGLSHSIYSLGANCKRTNIKIASTVLEHLDKPESLIEHFRDRPWRDLRHTNDTARAMATLGWQPLIPFQERFEKVVRELGAALGPN